jgi:hypothetical protein
MPGADGAEEVWLLAWEKEAGLAWEGTMRRDWKLNLSVSLSGSSWRDEGDRRLMLLTTKTGRKDLCVAGVRERERGSFAYHLGLIDTCLSQLVR